MIAYRPPRVAGYVPVVDLGVSRGSPPDAVHRAAAEIRTAARDSGFFYVVDHGIARTTIDREFDAARRFFEQPLEAKMAIDIRQSACRRGYEPIGLQTLDEGSAPDLKESLMLGRDLDSEHPWVRSGTPYEGPNQWPPGLSGFREDANAYLVAVMDLGRRLAGLLARSLDLPIDYFADQLIEPSCTTRMLRYPPQSIVSDNQIGCGAHTDWGFLTMLLQDDAGGLEVQNVAGDWILAPPIADSFVVNLGDMVPRMTSGLYRSTPHRVLNNRSGRDRYSVASFFNPGYHCRVSCVPTCVPEDGRVPEEISFGQHIQHMFALTYGKAA